MQPSFERGSALPRPLWNPLPALVAAIRVSENDRTRSLMVLRFLLMNMLGFALLGAAALQGWVLPLFDGSARWMMILIVATFAVGLAWCFRLIVDTGAELDEVKSGLLRPGSRTARHLSRLRGAGDFRRAAIESALKIKLAGRIAGVRHMAGSLVFLGLIGTVLGFMIALSGVDPATAGDVTSVAPMVATLIDGMGLALSTTLAGAVLNLWLMANYRILEHGTGKLLAELIERGAPDADT